MSLGTRRVPQLSAGARRRVDEGHPNLLVLVFKISCDVFDNCEYLIQLGGLGQLWLTEMVTEILEKLECLRQLEVCNIIWEYLRLVGIPWVIGYAFKWVGINFIAKIFF